MEQILVGSILGISFIDDMSSRKVHNLLILCFALASLLFFSLFSEWQSSQLLSFLTCQATCLGLVYFRVLGAGDWKLFSVISLFVNVELFLKLFLLAMLWNAMAGSLRFLLFQIQQHKSNLSFSEKMKFPYTFGILLAWFSIEFLPLGGIPW